AAGGLVMLICAYGLAITPPYYPPVHLAGRITGLHIAASAGCGCLAASIAAFLFSLARRPLPRMALTAALAAYLAVLAGFQHRVQLDYITAWKYQREFWKQVVRLCPDLDEGTLIIHDSFPLVEHVLANSWADATILDRLFTFPATWKNAPRLFSLEPTWRDEVQVEGDHLTWANPGGLWAPHRDILHAGNVIVLTGPPFRMELTRLTGTIRLCGRDLPLKPPGPPTLSQYPPGPLHAIVLGH
ncbi:MAG TPA: hypothetical protein VG672_27705, partial [Bryobacteraceae bacterium]|nr:hypothetical protein [Bryobacteraceae bacterium]